MSALRALSLIFGFVIWVPNLFASEVEVAFDKEAVNIGDIASQELTNVANIVKDQADIVIRVDMRTAGLKPTSKAYIIERTRSLKIFQHQVKLGVDPSRILFNEIKAGGSATLQVLTVHDSNAGSTQRFVPKADTKAQEEQGSISVTFGSASSDPIGFEDTKLKEFLQAVGRSGHDALLIEGRTDSSGNPAYNQVLGELRALRVYERLVRAGLPPYRIDTRSVVDKGPSKKQTETEKQAARRVIMRWTSDPKIAEVAAVEDKKILPISPQSEPSPPLSTQKTESVVEAVSVLPSVTSPSVKDQTDPQMKSHSELLDILVFGGALSANSKLKGQVKNSGHFGLGIGKNVWYGTSGSARLSLAASGKTKLRATDPTLTGSVNVSTVTIRADYLFGTGRLRPFTGMGAGYYVWDGAIKQIASGRKNVDKHSDAGGLIAVGLDCEALSAVHISPEVSYHAIGGEFSEPLLTAHLVIRWSI